MALHLHNTLTGTVQPFEPLQPGVVKMYVCGPTVYDEPHIGHARSAYIFDVLRRYLQRKGFQVQFVRNVTDVDDKIIDKAKQEFGTGDRGQGTGALAAKCQEVAQRYLKSYHETLERLGIGQPTEEPLATKHVVPEMTDLISKLLLQGVAYEAGGDVYFAVRKFPDYGKLSNRTVDELQAGARVEPGEHKRDPLDFALWKSAKPGEPSWDSPWGKGRPGWHIECTLMSTKYLGDEFDIHGGGLDLIFPHHENELAQAQAAGKPFARYWVHNGLLTVNGEKMSKSLGNFVTVDKALEDSGGESDVIKTFFLGTHYRSPIDYSVANMKAAGQRFDAFDGFLLWVRQAERFPQTIAKEAINIPPPKEIEDLKAQFDQAMDDDMNTPRALAVLDQLVNYGNKCIRQFEKPPLERAQLQEWKKLPFKMVCATEALAELGQVLGLFSQYRPIELTAELSAKIQEREAARKRGDFKRADQIRCEFRAMGLNIEDTDRGPVVRKKR